MHPAGPERDGAIDGAFPVRWRQYRICPLLLFNFGYAHLTTTTAAATTTAPAAAAPTAAASATVTATEPTQQWKL